MRQYTVHFIGGPYHGMDQAAETDSHEIKVAMHFGRPWWVTEDATPPDYYSNFEEGRYTRIARWRTDAGLDRWLLIYVFDEDSVRRPSPRERIQRARAELAEAERDLR